MADWIRRECIVRSSFAMPTSRVLDDLRQYDRLRVRSKKFPVAARAAEKKSFTPAGL
jgi:hypothetical protein